MTIEPYNADVGKMNFELRFFSSKLKKYETLAQIMCFI